MKITPLKGFIQIDPEEAKAGVLNTSSRESAKEYAKVLEASKSAELDFGVKKGDYIFVKSWAIDIVDHNQEKYYFVNLETNGILAVIK